MAELLVENMRRIADLINEFNNELDKNPKNKDLNNKETHQSLDDILTKPADNNKIVNELNIQQLIQKMNIDADEASAFTEAVNALGTDNPKLTTRQANALLSGFLNVSRPQINEDFHAPVNFQNVRDAIQATVEYSPESKYNINYLLITILKSLQQKSIKKEFQNAAFNLIINAIRAARENNQKEVSDLLSQLKHISPEDVFSATKQVIDDINTLTSNKSF